MQGRVDITSTPNILLLQEDLHLISNAYNLIFGHT